MCINKIDGTPRDTAILKNAHTLVHYAQILRLNKPVPIVEWRVLLDGDHGVDETVYFTKRELNSTFPSFNAYDLTFESPLLKLKMIKFGTDSPDSVDLETVVRYTLRTRMRGVPRQCRANSLLFRIFISTGHIEIMSMFN